MRARQVVFAVVVLVHAASLHAAASSSIVGWGFPSLRLEQSMGMRYTMVAAGAEHSLGLQKDGSIVAWGDNSCGQCNVPAPNRRFTAIAAGGWFSLGARSDGTVAAWGDDRYGQCGIRSMRTAFVAIAARAQHSVALNSDGSVIGWGSYGGGHSYDVPPSLNREFVAIAAGENHNLGLKADGSIFAWGENYKGQRTVPAPNTDFVAIGAGTTHSLGVKKDGSVVAWGSNTLGECNVPSPNTGFVAVAGGEGHSLGLKQDGCIVGWGYNGYGQCNAPEPNSDFIAIAAGRWYSLGLRANGSVVAWGYNYYGQCNVPAPNTDFTAIATGFAHSVGLKKDGSVVAWGMNFNGQCDVPSPNTGFVAIAAGYNHSLGLKADAPAVREAKLTDDMGFACIYGAPVSAAWDNAFYLEADDRSSGIRVEKTAHGLTANNVRANVAGTLRTNLDGERYIEASAADPAGAGTVKPLAMPNKSIGGGDFHYAAGPPKSGQQGVTDGTGLNNIGLLVKVWGRVTASGTDPRAGIAWLYVNDGSNVKDGTGIIGVYCEGAFGINPPAVGSYAVVTGVSGCELYGGNLVTVLRVRDQDDIIVMSAPVGSSARSVVSDSGTRPREATKPE